MAANLNFAIVGPVGPGHLTVFPANEAVPDTSLVNFVAGQTVANAADVKVGAGGAISVRPSDSATTNLVIDVYGYFSDVEELTLFNTAAGVGALALITSSSPTGSANTATGAFALNINITGSENTATGINALGSNSTGSANTATGDSTPVSNSTGSNNTTTALRALGINRIGGSKTPHARSAVTVFRDRRDTRRVERQQSADGGRGVVGQHTWATASDRWLDMPPCSPSS